MKITIPQLQEMMMIGYNYQVMRDNLDFLQEMGKKINNVSHEVTVNMTVSFELRDPNQEEAFDTYNFNVNGIEHSDPVMNLPRTYLAEIYSKFLEECIRQAEEAGLDLNDHTSE